MYRVPRPAMSDERFERRKFLRAAAGCALGSGMSVTHSVAAPRGAAASSTGSRREIRFAVCGMSHDHIFGMVDAIRSAGGTLAAAYGTEPRQLERFRQKYPDCRTVASAQEILEDSSIQLVLSSTIANERAMLGISAMRRDKDFLSDKPGATTLEQIEAIRRAVAETGRTYGIVYSERFEVRAAVLAGDLVHSGAIGAVIQTINIAPHRIAQKSGALSQISLDRPDWFWDSSKAGGILCDLGSHQADQFLYYTGSTKATVVSAQVANVSHPLKPEFHDFGDMNLRGDRGVGYVRVDWLTPDGLGTWGDGRLFILGTEGYIEVRKYCDVARSLRENNLFIVDRKESRMIDCNQVPLPFGAQVVADVLDRTHTAQDQAQCLLAAELAIRAQMAATTVAIPA